MLSATHRFPVFADPVVWLALTLFMVTGVLFFPGAGPDDAYMTFWAADMLAQHGDLLNYNGEAVEQSSSLGFAAVTALVSSVTGLEASVAGKCLAVVFGLAACLAAARSMLPLGLHASRATAWLIGTCVYFVFWSFSGMEGTLAALVGTSIVQLVAKVLDDGPSARRLVVAVGLMLTYVACRPEGMFILGSTIGAMVIICSSGWAKRSNPESSARTWPGSLLLLGLVCLATAGTLLAFRLWLFGLAFPEPVYAKSVGLGRDTISRGLGYLVQGSSDAGRRVSEFLLILVGASVGAAWFIGQVFWSRTHSWLLPICGLFLLGNLAFVVLAGGDGMPAGRFLIPVIPVAAMLVAALINAKLSRPIFTIVIVSWCVLQVTGGVVFATTTSMASSYPAWAFLEPAGASNQGRFTWFERMNHSHRRYMPAVAALEGQARRLAEHHRPVSILSGQSGFVMYQLTRANAALTRYVDRFGLVTRDFRLCPLSASAARSMWGLEISIEDYLAKRDGYNRDCGIPYPDIIFDLFWEESLPKELEQALGDAGYKVVYVQSIEPALEAEQGRAYVSVRALTASQ